MKMLSRNVIHEEKTCYGYELIIDASGCDPSKFTREHIEDFLEQLCEMIDMERALEPFFWDEVNGGASDEPHLKGVSCVQFIETSNIVIHTLSVLKTVFFNIFTCKPFDKQVAENFIKEFFGAQIMETQFIERNYVKNI